jgi:23S rRNA (adenine2503-C2)-methyltransferase
VLIPEKDRTTLCVSTQVGCPMACDFCATGSMGFSRNLSTAEIVDQVCRMRELLAEGQSLTNVVFMGMGEPLLNFEAVVEALRLLVDPKAFAMAPSRVTVSTVGIVPRMAELLARVPVNLAVSLHATTDDVRDRLVPINRRFPLRELLGALRRIDGLSRRRPIFFEYALIAGLNDSLDDARRLRALLEGIPSKINVIPLNPHPGSSLAPPDEAAIDRFVGAVARSGLTVTLRRSRGADIQAACGQLALRTPSASAA